MSDHPALQPIPTTDISLRGEEHVRLYRDTDGQQGYIWNGVPTLLLTTTGRKSGEPRTIAIIYTPWRDCYVIIASKGGAPAHPKWYLNILDQPEVAVQVKADRFRARARTATSPEREQIWAECIKAWPNYDIYQSRTERQIPVVVLERIAD